MKRENKEKLDGILAQCKGERGELIPILQAAQAEFGYLPKEVMVEIAKYLRMPASVVFGVSTFYAQFKFVPMGKRIIRVCRGTACHVRGRTGYSRSSRGSWVSRTGRPPRTWSIPWRP